MSLSLISRSYKNTRDISSRLGKLCQPGDWFGLTGELGAGKTCFAQGLALGLGVDPAIPVTSPTFIIHNTYPGRISFHHLDLYRLGSLEELLEIGYQELLEQEAVMAVEWYQRIPDALPKSGVTVEIYLIDVSSRRIQMNAIGPRGVDILDQLKSFSF